MICDSVIFIFMQLFDVEFPEKLRKQQVLDWNVRGWVL